MTWEELHEILQRGDENACIKLLEKAGEKERQAVAKFVIDWFKKQRKTLMVEEKPGHFRQNPLWPAANIALLGCASFGQIKEAGQWLSSHAYEVMAARRPLWINEWAELMCQWSPANRRLIRRLVREGICRRPKSDNYLLGLLNSHDETFGCFVDVRQGILGDADVLQEELWHLFEVEGDGEFSLATRDKYVHKPEGRWSDTLVQLSKEGKLPRPRLLDASLDALERDFAQFRAGWFSRFHDALKPTLEERAERTERYLRLLTSRIPPTVSFALKSIKLLDKEERLSPGTVVEHIGPALFARAKGTVLAGLGLLDSAIQGDATPMTKSPVPFSDSIRQRGVQLAATALAHESTEVQEAVLDLIQKYGDPTDRDLTSLLREKEDQIAASLRSRLGEWLGATAKPQRVVDSETGEIDLKPLLKRASSVDREFARFAGVDVAIEAVRRKSWSIPALIFDGTEIPRLDPDKVLRPVQELDELIELFAAVLENPAAVDDVERVLDGVSRLCDQRPSDFAAHTGPLRKRAFDLMKRDRRALPFSGQGWSHDLFGLALSWITGCAISPEVLPRKKDEHGGITYQYPSSWQNWTATLYRVQPSKTIDHFVSGRVWRIAQRAAVGKARPLLSAPTHAGGWIDPRVLVERLSHSQEMKTELDTFDQVQSLLRLAPDHRPDALRRSKRLQGEFAEALRYALGEAGEKIGPTAPLWVAAARARAPFSDDPIVESRHPNLGPDAGIAACYRYSVTLKQHTYQNKTYSNYVFDLEREPIKPKKVASEFPTVLLHGQILNPERLEWPLARESVFAVGAYHIGLNLDWWEARWENRLYLEPLLDPDVPLKTMGLLLLTLGLAAKEPGEHGLAVDTLIAAIDDGRVDGTHLGNVLASLLPTGLVLAGRYAKTLGDTARASALHAQVVIDTIERALQGDPTRAPRDIQKLLELLRELLVAAGEQVSDPGAIKYLSGLKASGKTAALVKGLLALQEKPAKAWRLPAAMRALSGRIERAERWTRRKKGKE